MTNYKAFDLQKAIAGEPLITRDGRKVDEFKYFEMADPTDHNCYAVIDRQIFSFIDNGSHYAVEATSSDLFMAPKTKKVFIALNKHAVLHTRCTGDFDMSGTTGFFFDKQKLLDALGKNTADYHIVETEIEV